MSLKLKLTLGSRRSPIRRGRNPARRDGSFLSVVRGRGGFSHVELEIEPGEPGTGLVFESKVVGGNVPREFIKPAQDGIAEAMTTGPVAGYPIEDVKVTLVDGSSHAVDSSEMAFKVAGSMGFKDGASKSDPYLMEPCGS